MDKDEQIRERMKKLAAMVGPAASLLGVVKSVQKSDYTCTITDDDDDTGLDYEEVRLRPVLDDTKGLTIFPKEGTWALAIRIEDEEDYMLIDCCEIESIELVIGELTLLMNDDAFDLATTSGKLKVEKNGNITFNDGSFDGLVKVGDLVTKLNNLENDINDLKTALAGWIPVASDGGAALKTALGTYFAAALTPTIQADIENAKVTHGI